MFSLYDYGIHVMNEGLIVGITRTFVSLLAMMLAMLIQQ